MPPPTSAAGSEHGDDSHDNAASADTALTEDSSGGDGVACTALFGRPTAATGLTDAQCRPECPCGDGWVAPTYDDAAIDALAARTLLDPPARLSADPYATPDLFPASPTQVCGVQVDGATYSLRSFAGADDAARAGATVTHAGACGLCSPLQDLAVYMRYVDLTEPVRACGLRGLADGDAANLQCLLDLGFSEPCAQIWFYNTVNTRTKCTAECFAALNDPYQLPDGSLNPCLACDEATSGPVFKAVAGRTRRNTGLASALCRPCADVQRLVHVYR